MKRYSFPSSMRLKQRKLIQLLFSKGQWHQLGLLRFYYLPFMGHNRDQVLIVVPKKGIKKAVKRNQVKRRMREAYRVLRNDLKERADASYLLGYIYTKRCNQKEEVPTYKKIYEAVRDSFRYLLPPLSY
ncbi:MAG: ribonuclease P protein component [Bacteroidota bacterium]